MSSARTVSENGSFRLVEQEGRFAVVEQRGGQLYGLQCNDGERPSAPDRPDAVARVVAAGEWKDEAEARRLFDDLAGRGDSLARDIW